MEVIGKTGETLEAQWAKSKGAQAYLGSYVHNFPNFAIIFGPNTFPAHNSVIFTSEVQVEYIAKTLVTPIIEKLAGIVEVKDVAEEEFARGIDKSLRGSVFSAGCSNW
jgi:cation diffusion facilitator CzcD-associated flavoprotein CzcO